jgi:hypothetical protein
VSHMALSRDYFQGSKGAINPLGCLPITDLALPWRLVCFAISLLLLSTPSLQGSWSSLFLMWAAKAFHVTMAENKQEKTP